MGYKKLIRDLIPTDWLVVLRQERAIEYYVDTVYHSFLSMGLGQNKGKWWLQMQKRCIVEVMCRCSFYATVAECEMLIEERKYWKSLANKIAHNKRVV